MKEIQNKTFFNSKWDNPTIENAVNTGYNEALGKGITSGQYTFSYKGEKVTIALQNGEVQTAFGDYRYTYEQLLNMAK